MSLRSRLLPVVLALSGVTLACTLTFSPALLQSLRLVYQLSAPIRAGEATVVQRLAFPDQITLKKRFLSVRGSLGAVGGRLPRRLELVAETVDLESGKRLGSLKLSLEIAGDGGFAAIKKLKKNLAAGSMTTVTIEPIGADLDVGTRVELCVDIVKRKADLAASPCTGGGATGPTTFSGIQTEVFTPSCAKGGCHDSASASAGLVLAAGSAYNQLVSVPSNQVPFRLRVDPGSPDTSYLMMKLRGAAGIDGVRMPLDGPPFLSTAELNGIASWIEAGAPND